MNLFKFLVVLIGCVHPFFIRMGFAQESISKEVRVFKPYEPTLSDAFKVNILPVIEDTVEYLTNFDYSITPKAFLPEYKIRPIRPAKIVGEPLGKLYNTLFKLGIGSYVTPYAELSINSLRSRKYSAGVFAKHISSQGKVKLDNDKKVYAGYSDNDLLFYGKKFVKNAVLTGDIGLKHNLVHFYGYNPTVIDTVLDKKDIKQNFLLLTGQTGFQSTHNDSTHLNYNVFLKYDFFRDHYKGVENSIQFQGSFARMFNKQFLGTDISLMYIDKSINIDSTYNAVVNFSPWFSKKTTEWSLKAGIDIAFDITGNQTKPCFYPKAKLQFNIVENHLSTYVGIDGHLEVNHYRKIAGENPFVIPGLHVKNSNHKLMVYGGFLGNISSSTSFKLSAKWELVDDMYFFINDTLSVLGNQFYAEYDNVEVKNIYGELATSPGEKLSFVLKGNYYQYTMSTQDRPWHKPTWDITLSARYNLRNKILLNADVVAESKQYARNYGTLLPNEIQIDKLIDLSLGIEYRYTKILSAFLRFYNITSSQYAKWNQYPTQRFFLMAGFTYAM
ncbi:MAG: hypothetical protein KAU83_01170 [Bacteroidales bacterium]|nr:hypothetical protein [Bacteroidales bacterium]